MAGATIAFPSLSGDDRIPPVLMLAISALLYQ